VLRKVTGAKTADALAVRRRREGNHPSPEPPVAATNRSTMPWLGAMGISLSPLEECASAMILVRRPRWSYTGSRRRTRLGVAWDDLGLI